MDWDVTPREAALMAENERLKGENAYLRRAVENRGDITFTPRAVIEERVVQQMSPTITLPVVASVNGSLSRYGDYHVLARLSHWRAQPEDLTVQYHAPADTIKANANYWPNELFPYLHKRFITALANAIHKPREEVA